MRLHARGLHSAGILDAAAGLNGESAGRVLARWARLSLDGAANSGNRRLRGAGDQATTIEVGIEHELPLAIFFLLVEFVDAFFVAGAGDADDGTAAKNLRLIIAGGAWHLGHEGSGLSGIGALILLRGVALLSGRRAVQTSIL